MGGYQVRTVRLSHSVPAVGYQITTPAGKRIFYTGDTGPGLDDCWRQVSPDLLVIEVTASDRWEKFARESLHMTPGLLRAELESFVNIHGYFPHVAAVHMNPDLQPEIEAELAQLSTDLQIKGIPAREGLVRGG